MKYGPGLRFRGRAHILARHVQRALSVTEQTNTAPRPARVAAIDPGFVKAGMVVLQIQPPATGYVVPASDAVCVLAARTSRRRRGQDFPDRIAELLDSTERWADEVRRNWAPDLWCVEDPRDFPTRLLSARGTLVTLGAAFGVACAAVNAAANRSGGADVTLVPALEWIPKTRGGRNRNLIVPMGHKVARAWLRGRWPALADLTDDETFASGVAIWAHTRGAVAAIYPGGV